MINTSNPEILIGQTAFDSDGDKIGRIGQVYVDDNDGQPKWLTVHTGLFGTAESFVPLERVTQQGDDVRVDVDKQTVKGAPSVDADQALSPEDEERLYSYYGLGSTGTADTVGTGTGYSDAGTSDTGVADLGASSGTGAVDDPALVDDAGTAGSATAGTVGHDTSGPTTDNAMTRSEERLHVGTETREAGRARLRKYVVTEQQTVTVPVSHEEVQVTREPITDANAGAAYDGPAISEEEHEVVLHEEVPVVQKEAVPVERVALGTETVTENEQVSEDVRKEQIDLDDSGTTGTNRGV